MASFHASFQEVLAALDAKTSHEHRALMDWAGWALFGLMATAALTAVMIAAQLAGLTRLDLPLVLGTVATEDPDRARVAGFFIHLAVGQGFALGYAAAFALLDRPPGGSARCSGSSTPPSPSPRSFPSWRGSIPAWHRTAPVLPAPPRLEPPGLFALNYGLQTPLVAVAAHVVYGMLLGLLLTAG